MSFEYSNNAGGNIYRAHVSAGLSQHLEDEKSLLGSLQQDKWISAFRYMI